VATFGVQIGQKLVVVVEGANLPHAGQICDVNNAAVFVVEV
jgi:hypothetical protein